MIYSTSYPWYQYPQSTTSAINVIPDGVWFVVRRIVAYKTVMG